MSTDRHPGYDCEPLKEPWLSRSEAILDRLEAHEFEPGIDIDDPENPSELWCNVCGEPHAAPLEPGGEP